MKTKPLGLALACILLAGLVRAEDSRTWTNTAGLTLQGKFVSATAQNVVVLKDDGTTVNIPRTMLSAGDLVYADKAMAARPIAVTLDVGRTKFSNTSATTDVTIISSEQWGYDIKLKNQGSVAGQNLRVDYRIFLQKAGDPGSIVNAAMAKKIAAAANSATASAQLYSPSVPLPALPQPPPPLARIDGTTTIAKLDRFDQVEVQTDPVAVKRTRLQSGYFWLATNTNEDVADAVTGIWLRVYQGDAMIAEFATSDALKADGWAPAKPAVAGP